MLKGHLFHKEPLRGGISDIKFRWLHYKPKEETIIDRIPHFPRFPWLGHTIQKWKKITRKPPTLQYQLYSELTREWTGWIDVPVVEGEDEKAFISNAKLKAEYGDLSNDGFKLDL